MKKRPSFWKPLQMARVVDVRDKIGKAPEWVLPVGADSEMRNVYSEMMLWRAKNQELSAEPNQNWPPSFDLLAEYLVDNADPSYRTPGDERKRMKAKIVNYFPILTGNWAKKRMEIALSIEMKKRSIA